MIKFGKKLKGAEKRLPLLVETFSRKINIIAVYLFGSQASNTSDELSDIDIALLMKKKPTFREEMDLAGEATSLLGTDEVSLVILNNAPLTVRYGVLKDAKLLYSADDRQRLEFEDNVIKRYLDFKHYLDIYDREFISMIKYGKAV